MFYTLIKTWVFDQSERAQGPIYILNIWIIFLNTVKISSAKTTNSNSAVIKEIKEQTAWNSLIMHELINQLCGLIWATGPNKATQLAWIHLNTP